MSALTRRAITCQSKCSSAYLLASAPMLTRSARNAASIAAAYALGILRPRKEHPRLLAQFIYAAQNRSQRRGVPRQRIPGSLAGRGRCAHCGAYETGRLRRRRRRAGHWSSPAKDGRKSARRSRPTSTCACRSNPSLSTPSPAINNRLGCPRSPKMAMASSTTSRSTAGQRCQHTQVRAGRPQSRAPGGKLLIQRPKPGRVRSIADDNDLGSGHALGNHGCLQPLCDHANSVRRIVLRPAAACARAIPPFWNSPAPGPRQPAIHCIQTISGNLPRHASAPTAGRKVEGLLLQAEFRARAPSGSKDLDCQWNGARGVFGRPIRRAAATWLHDERFGQGSRRWSESGCGLRIVMG